MKCHHCIFPLVAAVVLATTTTKIDGQDRVVLLDGTVAEGNVEAIDPQGRITGENLPTGLVVDGLRRIETPAAAAKMEASTSVEFAGGGVLGLTAFAIDDKQTCHLSSDVVGKLNVPLEALRWVRFNAGNVPESFATAATEKNDEDRVFVKLGGGLEPIDGLIETIDEFKVVIDPGSGPRTIARDKVYGVVFAQVGRAPDHSGEALLTLADGSTLWGKIDSLAEGELNLSAAGGVKISLPWTKVSRLSVRSTRMVFLSDLEPVEARHQPLVTLERPWQVDKSVGGRPLTLSGRRYDKGLGVAARSILVFNNEGGFRLLAATIGIDEETQGRGDCIFVVEVDGREKYRQRVTGRDLPRAMRVDIQGGERISLIVEAGEDLDLSDHADWCDARFVKQ